MARSSSPEDSPAPPDEERLAQLEALLADSLFSAPTRNHPAHASEDAGARPAKRKKTEEDGDAAQDASEAGASAGEGAVAFRLFSTQKTPQKVFIREAESPEPVVRDPRIRDVDDESPEVRKRRRKAIVSVAVDGESVLTQARSLPSAYPPSHRITLRQLARPPSAPSHPLASSSHPFVRPSSATPAPTLAFLDTLLPPSLLAKSPFPVPCIEDDDAPSNEKDSSKRPPERPHDGLIAHRPFEGVYAQGEGKKERMPLRNEVMRLGKGTGLGRLVVRAVYPDKGVKLGGEGKKRKRLSKERRERAWARRSAAEKGAKA
ncbi:Cross-beta structure silk protein 2 [Rhodotorula toruloides ATCC 204091]|uniref:Uncharacterized protein n=2 Tax=Rhodotorula toruloides TaxID=5286 RepID=A0A2T0AIV3_RHOTO|nr:Cross-beta structure silk protein 2 [Rhodotorula toruloides ATCC 204091]KAK4331511.1 Cross-beta structure silk protein 2 [Rhodotorula toruloides]PRQ77936.1 hypothetical protein AAT19DRAFT_9004 [Rhodotorula toruloides]